MAPVRRNGVLLKSTGPDSGERRVGKCAHSAPGRDATVRPAQARGNSTAIKSLMTIAMGLLCTVELGGVHLLRCPSGNLFA